MAELNYQANYDDAQENSFDPLPAGEYLTIIENSDYVPNNKGNGMILKLTYQVIDGPQKGKKLFENLNLENPSQQAVEISRRTLNAVCLACGVTNLKDSSLLHNIPLKLDVKVKDDATYGMQNKIAKHIKVETGQPNQSIQPAEQPATTTQEQPAQKKKQPWEK